MLAGIERRHLVDRADHESIFLLEDAHPLQQLRLRHQRARDVFATQARARFDLRLRLGLELRSAIREQTLVRIPTRPLAKRDKDLVDIAKIGTGILDDAAERLEGAAL